MAIFNPSSSEANFLPAPSSSTFPSSQIPDSDQRRPLPSQLHHDLSPLAADYGPHAGDPSEGWLFRVSEVNPNRFRFLSPMFPGDAEFPPGTIPSLNLLDHRITQVCRCYSLKFFDGYGNSSYLNYIVRKVAILWNYAEDCDFAVIVLYSNMDMSYWKFGEKAWTPINVRRYDITDVAVCDGKCYAIGRKGVLVSFDSRLSPKVVHMPRLPVDLKCENYLMEYDSDLYVVSKTCDYTSSDEEKVWNELGNNAFSSTPLELKIFKKWNNTWEQIKCLGDEMILSADDVSIRLSAEDFRGREGNLVYVAHTDYFAFMQGIPEVEREGKGLHYGVFRLDGDGASSALKIVPGRTLDWPFPEWLKRIAQDN